MLFRLLLVFKNSFLLCFFKNAVFVRKQQADAQDPDQYRTQSEPTHCHVKKK